MKEETIRGYSFQKVDDCYVIYGVRYDIMLTPINPKDKHTKWEIWLHNKDGSVEERLEGYSKESCVVLADNKSWFSLHSHYRSFKLDRDEKGFFYSRGKPATRWYFVSLDDMITDIDIWLDY